jgi:hypothetical protein
MLNISKVKAKKSLFIEIVPFRRQFFSYRNFAMKTMSRENWWISNSICSKKNDDSDFEVFGIKMTGHTGLEEKSKKIDKFVTRTKL